MIPLKYAHELATKYKELLAPFCERIEIAGSIRRRKLEVKDIELVLIPRPRDIRELKTAVDGIGKRVKGQITGKYTQRRLQEYGGINIDIFIVSLDTWGMQMALRTGPKEYSHHTLAMAWVKKGYHAEEAVLYPVLSYGAAYGTYIPDPALDYMRPVYFREERDLYKFLGLLWEDPWERG